MALCFWLFLSCMTKDAEVKTFYIVCDSGLCENCLSDLVSKNFFSAENLAAVGAP